MNWLWHWFLSKGDLSNWEYCLGKNIADMNRRHYKKEQDNYSPIMKIAIEEHKLEDHVFHAVPWLEETRKQLQFAYQRNTRFSYTLFEIGLEIAIDRIIFERLNDGFSDIIYNSLKSKECQAFLSEKIKGRKKLKKKINGFVKERVIDSYGTREGGRKALNRVYKKEIYKRYKRYKEVTREPKEIIHEIYDMCNRAVERERVFIDYMIDYLVPNTINDQLKN